MRKIKKKKSHKRLLSRRQLAFVVVCIIGFITLSTMVVQKQLELSEARQRLDDLSQRLALQRLSNIELSAMLSDDGSEYIEYKARDELDMVLPGERVYIIRNGG